jgi:hypothetical protein
VRLFVIYGKSAVNNKKINGRVRHCDNFLHDLPHTLQENGRIMSVNKKQFFFHKRYKK